MSNKWERHPQGPIMLAVAQLAHMPEWLLGGNPPWQNELSPTGRWRLIVKCEWTGTVEEFEEYRSRQDHPAGNKRITEPLAEMGMD